MKMGKNTVINPSTLENLALEVSCKEILSNLILCPDHRPKEKKLKWLPFSSLLSTIPYLQSEQLIAIVRGRLGKYLLGIMGDKIRRKYVNTFHGYVSKYGWQPDSDDSEDEEELEEEKERQEECLVDLWAFLDCVLDDGCEKLATHIAFPGCEPTTKLIETIAKRSPLLKKLVLHFRLMKEGTKSEILQPVILSLRSLEQLVDLSLYLPKDDDKLRPSLLSLLGNACPLLRKLDVEGGSRFSNQEIYGLVMGERAYNKLPSDPEWLLNSEFSRLEVPEKYLSPICSTLRELRLHQIDDVDSNRPFTSSSAVFILRHFNLLEKMKLPLYSAEAVKELHKKYSSKLEFEKHCEQEFPCQSEGPSQLNSKSSFTGSLSLKSIDFVDPYDIEMLVAVGCFCPLLQEASFHGTYGYNRPDFMFPDELETLLNKWPKLTTITLEAFQPEYVTTILKVFGADLIELRLFRCKFDVRTLLSCSKLETLRIFGGCTFLDDPAGQMDPLLNQSTFLPLLKDFHSDICLGSWSSIFENKSTLMRLNLSCCHVGFKEKEPRDRSSTAASQSVWNLAPRMWPRLEDLMIQSCVGLTFTMLANLAPQFPKLKRISLPYKIKEHRLLHQLSRQNPCIEFNFFGSRTKTKCPYLEQYEMSEEASNS